MRAWVWAVSVAALCGQVTGAPVAVAEPQGGFGLAGGLALHAGRVPAIGGPGQSYSSGGASLAGDAQFVINERWSLNPYLLLSLERSDAPLSATISNGAAGLELRRWRGGHYLGLRTGAYVELIASSTNVSTAYGPGLGMSLGGEREDGFSWGLSLDLSRVTLVSVNHIGLRLNVGRRWSAP
jgi:hypothetical protein